MKKIVFGFILISALSCGKSEHPDPCSEFDAIDREMLDMIKAIRTKYKSNKKFLSNFNMEQVYWINYRDHHLKSVYPEDWSRHYRQEYGKEVFNPCKCKEMTRFTKERIIELELWSSRGPAGQDECPSLWKE